MDKGIRKLVEQAMDQGFEFSEGAKNFKLLPPDKTKAPVFISKTPSARNARNRILADLKRSGFVVPDRKKKGGEVMDELEWEVHLEAAGEGPVDEESLADLSEYLAEFDASVTGSPEEPVDGKSRFGASFGVSADSPVQAMVTASEIFLSAIKRTGLPEWPIVRVELITADELASAVEQPTVPELVGITEISRILGVSRQRASELARSSKFPKPVTELASGPVWIAANISRFVDEWERRPGRPRKDAARASP